VDTLNGVVAYSNDSGGPIGCYNSAAFQWECVEFIQRYYSQRFNLVLGGIPLAFQALSILKSNPLFAAYSQGSSVMPGAEDIIVFGTSTSTPYGHVAIAKSGPVVQADGSYQIPIIEQNSYLNHVLVLQGDPVNGFKITGRLGIQNTAPIIGWVRRASVAPQPTVVFSNFAPNSEFDRAHGFALSSTPGGQVIGQPFTTGSSSAGLDEIDLAVAQYQGVTSMDVWLMSDTNSVPGSIIETMQVSNIPFYNTSTGYNPNPPISAMSVLHPQLLPATRYWVVTAPTHQGVLAAWYWTSPNNLGLFAQRSDANVASSGWTIFFSQENLAFRVIGH
jgi:hypothetical protein